jgi:hypothetical protein
MASAHKVFTIREANLAFACNVNNKKHMVGFTHLEHAKRAFYQLDRRSRVRVEKDDGYSYLVIEKKPYAQFGKMYIKEVTDDTFFSYITENTGVLLTRSVVEDDFTKLVFDCQVSSDCSP